jgi:hypothetical protein
MPPQAESVLQFAYMRHRDALDEAARLHLTRKASQGRPESPNFLATARRQLAAMLGSARQQVSAVLWPQTWHRRGAIPR